MNPPAVAIVDPSTPGNIGTIARAMKNFGFSSLLLVNPPPLESDGDAYGFAGQARTDILPNSTELSFEELVNQYYTVGFTAVTGETADRHVRYPFTRSDELISELRGHEDAALVFGRERTGLTNSELARIDSICSIPANPDYPTLNLGQAATIVLYELRSMALDEDHLPAIDDRASSDELERFYDHFDETLADLSYPSEKHGKTMRMIRRLIGRANPTGRELVTLRGVLRRASRRAESDDIDQPKN